MSVPAQHQVGTRLKLKPKTKEFNITTHEPENPENHLNTLTFKPRPFYIYSYKELICVLSVKSIRIQEHVVNF